MSVIVKGMKTPDDCWNCWMGSQGTCYIMGNIWDGMNRIDIAPTIVEAEG